MKKLLVLIATVGFAATAYGQNTEIQISNNSLLGGTQGSVNILDEDLAGDDRTQWGLQGEAYYLLNDKLQVGGMLGFGDQDTANSELSYNIGAAVRYNLDSDLRNSIFLGGGVAYIENGFEPADSTTIGAFVTLGKRFALSETITYTPNLTYMTRIGGDDGYDEGSQIAVNLISFSGFLNL